MRFKYTIKDDFIEEALSYAKKSRAFTSNRHDFHPGGLDNKQHKMFEGKLGEKHSRCFLSIMISLLQRTVPPQMNATNMTFYCIKMG